MSQKQRICSFLVIIVSVIFLVSCGKKEDEYSSSYEKPAVTMAMAIANGDTKAYLNCYTYDAKEAYINGDSYNADLVKTFLPSQTDNIIKVKTNSDEIIEETAIEDFEKKYKEKYKKRIEIDKARKITVTFTLLGEKPMETSLKLTMVKSNSRWFVFGDVIEKLKFAE